MHPLQQQLDGLAIAERVRKEVEARGILARPTGSRWPLLWILLAFAVHAWAHEALMQKWSVNQELCLLLLLAGGVLVGVIQEQSWLERRLRALQLLLLPVQSDAPGQHSG